MNNDVLYITGVTTSGEILIGGIWKMKSQMGFPVEMTWMELQARKGYCPDWAEYLADAGSVPLPGFDFCAARDELKSFLTDKLFDEIYSKFIKWFITMHTQGDTFYDTCVKLLASKKKDMHILNDLVKKYA